jgi:hypothetical protein
MHAIKYSKKNFKIQAYKILMKIHPPPPDPFFKQKIMKGRKKLRQLKREKETVISRQKKRRWKKVNKVKNNFI